MTIYLRERFMELALYPTQCPHCQFIIEDSRYLEPVENITDEIFRRPVAECPNCHKHCPSAPDKELGLRLLSAARVELQNREVTHG